MFSMADKTGTHKVSDARQPLMSETAYTSAMAEKRMAALYDIAQGAILTVGADMTITSANKMIAFWINRSPEDVVGLNCCDVFNDAEGIQPQDVAAETFKSGLPQSDTYSSNRRFAELSAYPIEDDKEIKECIVIIRETTDTVIHQHEIIDLYQSVSQTKDRLESLIENSADAIITTDLDGTVQSWNKSAERIFGFSEEEIAGHFLPFLSDSNGRTFAKYFAAVGQGDILRDIEISGKRKDSGPVEISITISPIKDASDTVTGITLIARDVSRRKIVERELLKSRRKLSHLFFISSVIRSTLALEKLLLMILTVVTAKDGLGFNRAILFLYDEQHGRLRGTMGIGPATLQEAHQIWNDPTLKDKPIVELLEEIEKGTIGRDTFLDRQCRELEISIADEGSNYLSAAVVYKKSFNVTSAQTDPMADPIVVERLGTEAYAVIPLIALGKVIGVLWVDNLFNKQQITGDDLGFISTFADHAAISIESARLFEQVSVAESELHNIFESISESVFITDLDMVITKVNKAVCELLGLQQEQVIGRKCCELFHNQDTTIPQCPYDEMLQRRSSVVSEIEGFYAGSKDTFSVSISPIIDSYGSYTGAVHIAGNVTQGKKLREQLAKMQQIAAMAEMTARVAHEIRNPLSSIGGFARRLQKRLDGPLQDYANIIVEEVTRLETILRQALCFVRESKMSNETIDINSVLRSVRQQMSTTVKDRVVFDEDYSAESLEITGNPNRLKEAFTNIVTNAWQSIQYSGRISIRSRREDDTAIVEIEDTGVGMEEAALSQIFDPFYTTRITGTGLGLAITSKIIEEHRATIDVKSTLGVGTIFKIKFILKEAR
ncbi:MAG: PAS domain S-box protein [Nitrospirae bacterium]|uniref:PAS domain S-box protein n=1 Tax=Candidatus Magnetobacterium casense TaxID=1455061 RepID=UPI00058B0EF8|nr:PAS domain S-box protein [Candidatus Magnetobacterium casensis]MBF0337327.1 PAS domain S-box protein [Nitrospirota bacterium]